jgi:4-amino-4-deoxy-L-arabinose transferase-like glycosyltransferase
MKRWHDFLIADLLFAAAFAVRLILASQMPFPPLDDPAFYLQTARNLAAGRGLVSDVIWSYQFLFPAVTHPSHEYWMPLATLLMAPWISLFHTTEAAHLSGVICGALLAPLTYWLGLRAEVRSRWVAGGAALLVAGSVSLAYQSASFDSAMPFALCAGVALIAGGLAVERAAWRWALLSGLASGLAYLARSDGLLVSVCVGAVMLLQTRPRRGVWRLWFGLVFGVAIFIVPWWWRNWAVFGVSQPVSPGTAIVLQDYAQLFSWGATPTLAHLWARGLPFIIDLRVQALLHNVDVWLLMTFPFGLLGVLGLLRERRTVFRLGLIYGVALFLTTAFFFSVPTLFGLFYHSSGAVVPWLAVGSTTLLRRLWLRRPLRLIAVGLTVGVSMLLLAQWALALPAVISDSERNQVRFAEITYWLQANVPADQPILTTQANTLNYASGYSALSIPVAQDAAVLRQVADRYGVRYVIVTERNGQYPQALEQPTARARLVAEFPEIWIYELER